MIGKSLVRRPAGQVGLGDVGERADHDVPAVVAHQLGRHGLHAAVEEHVQEQRLHHVVAMVAERDLGGAELARHAVEDAAAQPRAQRHMVLPSGIRRLTML